MKTLQETTKDCSVETLANITERRMKETMNKKLLNPRATLKKREDIIIDYNDWIEYGLEFETKTKYFDMYYKNIFQDIIEKFGLVTLNSNKLNMPMTEMEEKMLCPICKSLIKIINKKIICSSLKCIEYDISSIIRNPENTIQTIMDNLRNLVEKHENCRDIYKPILIIYENTNVYYDFICPCSITKNDMKKTK